MRKRYKPGTSGNLMVTDFLTMPETATVADAREDISEKRRSYRFMDYGYLVDKNNNLLGAFSIGDLFRHPEKKGLKKITKKNPVTVAPGSRAEYAAHQAVKFGVKAIPVVSNGKILGVLPSRVILKELHQSSQEDFLHLAGIHKSHLEYEDTMKIPVLRSVKHRASWLIIGLFGIMFGAGLMSAFEESLKEHMILAFFIPAILYLAGALSAQLVTLCVRDLAAHGKNLKKFSYLIKQLLISTILGAVLSSITFLTVLIFWNDPYIGFVISTALFFAAIFTNITSLLITLLIDKMGRDPAFGSGPFATVISDVAAIMIYLMVASLMLP